MLVNVLVGVGMLAVVPLGLRLIDGVPLWMWYLGAIPGAASLWLPRGGPATALAALYRLATMLLASRAPALVLPLGRLREDTAGRIAAATALVTPAIAASALVAERAGVRLFGFRLEVLALTTAHFHYAGFAAALIAGLVGRLTGNGAAALTVPAGTGLVLLGYFTSPWVELAGAAVLTAGMWLTAWVTLRRARPAAADPVTRTLLAVSALTLAATMLLALDWALGRTVGLPHLSLSWMVATHGLANALGFALCGVLAWRRLPVAPAVRV